MQHKKYKGTVSQFAFLSIHLGEISLKMTDEIKWSA